MDNILIQASLPVSKDGLGFGIRNVPWPTKPSFPDVGQLYLGLWLDDSDIEHERCQLYSLVT
jgi:hypothetical protein